MVKLFIGSGEDAFFSKTLANRLQKAQTRKVQGISHRFVQRDSRFDRSEPLHQKPSNPSETRTISQST